MQICQSNDWAYIVVLKDDSLKILQQDIADTENKQRRSIEHCSTEAKGKTHIKQLHNWINLPFCYSNHTLYWFSCQETITRYDKDNLPLEKQDTPTTFVWLTNLQVTQKNVRELAHTGRSRWKIENEGFNTQKNGGYALGHKYSRKSFDSYRNYYQCMQMAHLINQLTEHSSNIVELKAKNKITIKHLWKQLLNWFTSALADASEFETLKRCQIRLL